MNQRTFRTATLLLALVLLATACTEQVFESPAAQKARALQPGSSTLAAAINTPRYIKGSYIVVFNDHITKNVDADADELSQKHGFKTDHRFKHAIKGFAGNLSDAAVTQLRNDPRVSYIEQNQEIHLTTTQTAPPSWGLDRVDQTTLPLDASYTYTQTGAGVDAYIIDTGILLSHTDLGGRAVTGYDAVTSGGLAIDGNGHGTHVSGTVGGNTYGIAKNVKLIAVRVLDNTGSGTTAGVIAGVDWVTSNHTTNPAVANMSLGGGVSTALDDAVSRSIADGVVYCIAAGNSAALATTSSPARVAAAITVGATDITDAFASFSNYGSTVDINAPGVNITSSWFTSTTATNTISGTSMATPHVTGVAALYMEANPTATPAQIQAAITTNSVSGKITSLKTGTPNLLLSAIVGPVPVLPPVPAAPALLSPANLATGVATNSPISWSAVTNATSYSVQVSTSSTFTSTTFAASAVAGTSVTPTGLAANTTYYWRVNASNLGGTSPYSTVFSFKTLAAPTAPALASPANAAVGVTAPTTLTWSASTGAVTYTVQVSKSSNFSSSNLVYNTAGITATTATVSGLLTKTKYYWRVSATNGGGTSAWSSARYFTTN